MCGRVAGIALRRPHRRAGCRSGSARTTGSSHTLSHPDTKIRQDCWVPRRCATLSLSPSLIGTSSASFNSVWMSAPWMSREPFVLLEDGPMEDAHAAEQQQRRHCSRREQLSATLATLACLSLLTFSRLHAQTADGDAEWPWPVVFAPLVGTAVASTLVLLASPLLLPVGQRYSAGVCHARPEPFAPLAPPLAPRPLAPPPPTLISDARPVSPAARGARTAPPWS
jgi:hypothetical protein